MVEQVEAISKVKVYLIYLYKLGPNSNYLRVTSCWKLTACNNDSFPKHLICQVEQLEDKIIFIVIWYRFHCFDGWKKQDWKYFSSMMYILPMSIPYSVILPINVKRTFHGDFFTANTLTNSTRIAYYTGDVLLPWLRIVITQQHN